MPQTTAPPQHEDHRRAHLFLELRGADRRAANDEWFASRSGIRADFHAYSATERALFAADGPLADLHEVFAGIEAEASEGMAARPLAF
jgi:hypothetical protein